jgi:hypothetical protein
MVFLKLKEEDVVNIVNRGRIRTSTWLGAVFVAVCVLGAGQVEAHKRPKVELCHFKQYKGVFKKISVSGRAARRHIRRHADLLPGGTSADGSITVDNDCKVVNAPTPVLARAYIDVDRNGLYDPLEDHEIAELLDTDETPGLSEGDTIQLGQYPTNYDPCRADPCTDIEFFEPPPLEVFSIENAGPLAIEVSSAGGVTYRWEHFSSGFSRFQITNIDPPTAFADILDSTAAESLPDLVFISVGGEPNAGVAASNPSRTPLEDDYFINVEFPPLAP